MTPALDAAQTALACLGVLLLHTLAYYVFVAVNAPSTMRGHEIDLPVLAVRDGER